jgi:hypothetical protein
MLEIKGKIIFLLYLFLSQFIQVQLLLLEDLFGLEMV